MKDFCSFFECLGIVGHDDGGTRMVSDETVECFEERERRQIFHYFQVNGAG
jgi:hypothetical protein